jgi:hypothetical protein
MAMLYLLRLGRFGAASLLPFLFLLAAAASPRSSIDSVVATGVVLVLDLVVTIVPIVVLTVNKHIVQDSKKTISGRRMTVAIYPHL